MPIHSIPEDKESYHRCVCPSLYTLIQFLCTVSSCAVLIACLASTLWIETFIDSGSTEFRYLSVGLWRVCYYKNISLPGTATECNTVKFNDFTLSVQICECFAIGTSCIAVTLFLVRIIIKCSALCADDKVSYNIRKYRIVCHLITILALIVSLPLYMCEANIEGVQLLNNAKRTESPQMRQSVNTSTATVTTKLADIGTTPREGRLEHHSVFGLALWMQFIALGLAVIPFSMALVKHAKKRKERYSQPPTTSRKRPRPAITLEMKSRPRSESQRAFFGRQSSSSTLFSGSQDIPVSP